MELLPTTPPTVARLPDEGSGPNISPFGFSSLLSESRLMPDSTVAVRASRSTASTRLRYLEKSITNAAPTVCPASEDPPPRGSTGTPWEAASSTAAMTSSADFGSTTPTGSIW